MIISTDNGTVRNALGDIEALRLIREAGFDGIDYTFYGIDPEADILALPDAERKALAGDVAAAAKDLGLVFPQAHAPFRYQLTESRTDKHYTDILRSFEFCARIGCGQMVIHTLKLPPGTDAETADSVNKEYMRSFLPYAREYGVRIGVENLFVRDEKRGCFLPQHGDPRAMNDFVDSLNDPMFTVCCDLGHCALTGCEPEAFIAGMSPDRLTMLHVQDLNYREDQHLIPYAGKLDWDAVTAALAGIGYRGAFNLEVLRFYEAFPKALLPDALRLAARVARHLADRVEEQSFPEVHDR